MDTFEVIPTKTFFTDKELKDLVKLVGVEKIHKDALIALNDLLVEIGTMIDKFA